jgi:hypothetical protein
VSDLSAAWSGTNFTTIKVVWKIGSNSTGYKLALSNGPSPETITGLYPPEKNAGDIYDQDAPNMAPGSYLVTVTDERLASSSSPPTASSSAVSITLGPPPGPQLSNVVASWNGDYSGVNINWDSSGGTVPTSLQLQRFPRGVLSDLDRG